ncbi:MAG: serpin family protein [Prevotella sp.]|nr:serpin family protein [Prevotella sp.]
MKKSLLFVVVAVCCMTASAAAPERKMLEQGKMWIFAYHHFEEHETGYDESIWPSYYQLDGEITIDERQYMKMYRWDEPDYIGDDDLNKKYYGAFREDEEGRVYMYNDSEKKDDMVLDFSLHYDKNYFPDVVRITETIKENGQLFRRYRYEDKVGVDDKLYDLGYVAVEGVGFQRKGFMFDPYAEEPTCICDYEELAYVESNNFWFSASAFQAPREIELTDGERQLIASNNDFAFNLFRKARGDESIVLSPLSITYALGMLNNGADGQTLQEINQTLGFGEAGADAINAFCQKMLIETSTLDDKTKALIANTIFVNEGLGYRLQDDFVKKVNDYYNAQPQNRNFYDGETMDVINQWANDHTEGMIPEVLNKFEPSAVSYLLNALYFKGAWSKPFDVAETKEESFGGGEAVPMMHKPYTDFEYTENDIYQAVNLPYGNGAYKMSVFLPREDKTVGDVLEVLNGSNWKVNGFIEVDVKLPRFETDTNLNLVKIMKDLGMPTAFTEYAEFPYFCNVPNYISNMFQVAKIKLDEEGTEAAAVTVIEGGATSIPPTAKFHATRPFLYVISEQSTGAIFFIGQYMGTTTTGIASPRIQKPTEDDVIYNLSGQRLSTPPAKGIYIRNGKKVVF